MWGRGRHMFLWQKPILVLFYFHYSTDINFLSLSFHKQKLKSSTFYKWNLPAFSFDSLSFTQNQNMILSTVSWLFLQDSHWQNKAILENINTMLYMIWFCSFQSCFNLHCWFIRLVCQYFFLNGPSMLVNYYT